MPINMTKKKDPVCSFGGKSSRISKNFKKRKTMI
jgi:hypothetical protein